MFEVGEIHPNTPHLFSDLAELLLLTNQIGRSFIHKSDLESLLSHGAISTDEIDEEADAEEEADKTGKSSAERLSRNEKQLDDLFSQLSYREKTLTEYYPFSISGEELHKNDHISEKTKIYRFLVACSRLRSFPGPGISQKWAKFFTDLCKIALGGLLPIDAEIRIFDANSNDRRTYYSPDLRQALKKLGDDLKVRVIHEECDRQSPSGDHGIDLVAIVRFDDGAQSNFAILGQCASQETGWPTKTLESHPISLRDIYSIQMDIPSVLFTPIAYREATGELVNNRWANGILLLDRGRILYLIGKQNKWQEIVTKPWFIEFESDLEGFIMNREEMVSD